MHRPETEKGAAPLAAPSYGGAGTDGIWTKGNPATATPATDLDEEFFNDFTENLFELLSAGSVTPVKGRKEDLKDAIVNLLSASAGFTTGDAKISIISTAPAGWVLMDDGSIGSAGSGATTRANADTEALYTALWDEVIDSWAPVAGGRGASAAADFAADKAMTLPRQLGRAILIAGSGSGLTARVLGEFLGEETHALTGAENGPHVHTVPGHSTPVVAGPPMISADMTQDAADASPPSTSSSGSGTAHNNMQPSACWHVMIKL